MQILRSAYPIADCIVDGAPKALRSGWHFIEFCDDRRITQGLKPSLFCGSYGTTEVVPCYRALAAFLGYKDDERQGMICVDDTGG
jgi:hypothetical protein